MPHVWCRCAKTLPSCVFCTPRLVCQGPYCTWKNICLFGLPCACGILQDCKIIRPMMIFYSAPFFAGSVLEAHYTLSYGPTRHWNGIQLERVMGRSVPHVWCRCGQDFAIMRFCTPRLLCQGPYCTWKIYACSRRMSSGFRKTKPLSLVYASLQKKSSYDDVILFCAILRQSGCWRPIHLTDLQYFLGRTLFSII